MPKKYDEWVEILENSRINEKYYKLIFRSSNLAKSVQPGQFLNIQVQPEALFFLRRPFSYYRIVGNKIEVLYEILGEGTSILSKKKKGQTLKVSGPLGKSFAQKPKADVRVLVAGGVGVPPLVYMAEKHKIDYLLIGTKSKAEVLPKKELAKVKAKVLYSTNDGSFGEKGFVTQLLEGILKENKGRSVFVQTCGPTVMMKAVMKLVQQYGVSGEASLEEDMACGIGACLGCMVKLEKGWVPSCVEGPVFNFDDLNCQWVL